MFRKIKEALREKETPVSWGRIWLSIGKVAAVLLVLVIGLFAYAQSYKDRMLPGVQLAGVPIGGMEEEHLEDYIQESVDKLYSEGWTIEFTVEGKSDFFIISPIIVTDGETIELANVDVQAEVQTLLEYGKDGDVFDRMTSVIRSRFAKPDLTLSHVTVHGDRVLADAEERLLAYATPPENARVIVQSIDPLSYTIVSSTPGILFESDRVPDDIVSAWSRLQAPVIDVSESSERSVVHEDDVVALTDRLPALFDDGDLTITYVHPTRGNTMRFPITTKNMRDWLSVDIVEGEISFVLDQDELVNDIETFVVPKVSVEARDAKFTADTDGRVTEFQGSRPGVEVDMEATIAAVNEAFASRVHHDEGEVTSVALITKNVEPNVRTGDVNDLGITEIIGVGLSNFSGSPTNRIRNIRNGVRKLNGVLLEPGEVFSTIEYTRPYTEEGGYYPELVIKGDEIKPEIGGGLCQLGTTLFRMAMNSGLDIVQRRNHSLVVSYYNDLENGLPGTDATIYEPAPDFKFKNDTDNYILIQAEMDVNTGYLTFTMWGTSDGRDGSYSRPVVERWIPHGETKEIPSTKIAVGERECQHAYRGAETSFTYTRTFADGTSEDRVFESYYRPLPQICLVGVEALPEEPTTDAPTEHAVPIAFPE